MKYSGATVRSYITSKNMLLESYIILTWSSPSREKRTHVLPIGILLISALACTIFKTISRGKIPSYTLANGKSNISSLWKGFSNNTKILTYLCKFVLNMSGTNYQISIPVLVMSLTLMKQVMHPYMRPFKILRKKSKPLESATTLKLLLCIF